MTLLIFPRAKPEGATISATRGKIKKGQSYPTTVIDYLKMDIYDSQQSNPYNYVGGGKTSKEIGSASGSPAKDTIAKTIYLYLPNKLAEQYSANYTNQRLGGVGSQAIGAVTDGLGEGFEGRVKAAAQSGKAQLGFKMGSDAINAVVGVTGGQSNLSANSLSALTQKRVFNPYEETTFEGMNFRTHNFNMKLVPRSAEDVKTIQDIINTLRVAMLPGKGGANGQWLTIPDFFKLSIVRYVDAGGDEKLIKAPKGKAASLSALMRFPTKLVLKDMSIDYAPDGNYASLMSFRSDDRSADFGPVSYNVSLTFAETALLTKNDYDPNWKYNDQGEFNFQDLKIPGEEGEGDEESESEESTETESGESK